MPLPKKLFSLTAKPILFSEVPKPAEAEISPVACSSTLILIILELSFLPSITSAFTVLK